MATVNFYLKESNAKFETPINALLHYDNSRFKFATGEKIHPKFWNPKRQRVKSNYPGSPEFNDKLEFIGDELMAAYRSSSKSKIPLTKEFLHGEMMKRLKRDTQKQKNFFDYYDDFVAAKTALIRINSIKKFISLKNHLQLFERHTKNKVRFENMNEKFEEQFNAFLLSKITVVKDGEEKVIKAAHLNNTVAKYISTLKSFLKWAVKREHNTYTKFTEFKATAKNSEIIYLTEEELMSLFSFDFKGNKKLSNVRDVFCFGCFTGLRYSDFSRVRKENIKAIDQKFYITITTNKTNDPLIVPLTDDAMEILRRNNFKLPVVSNQKMNDSLKEMGEAAGIDDIQILTSYSGKKRIVSEGPKHQFLSCHDSRRTFITLSLEKGMRIETVMDITEIKDYKTLKRYIKITNKVKMIEMSKAWDKKSDHLKVVV